VTLRPVSWDSLHASPCPARGASAAVCSADHPCRVPPRRFPAIWPTLLPLWFPVGDLPSPACLVATSRPFPACPSVLRPSVSRSAEVVALMGLLCFVFLRGVESADPSSRSPAHGAEVLSVFSLSAAVVLSTTFSRFCASQRSALPCWLDSLPCGTATFQRVGLFPFRLTLIPSSRPAFPCGLARFLLRFGPLWAALRPVPFGLGLFPVQSGRALGLPPIPCGLGAQSALGSHPQLRRLRGSPLRPLAGLPAPKPQLHTAA